MQNFFDPTKVHGWVHNLDPFLIQFSQHFGIRWYGLAYMFGFISGAYIMMFMAKRGRRTLPADQVLDFVTYCVLGTMIGGRVGYAVFYSPDLLIRWDAMLTVFGTQIPVWNLLAVWEGGMASHGGIIGLILASFLYARRHHQNWLHLGDLTTLGGTLGIVCGRLANFVNGELMGRPVQSAIPWAVKFPQDMYRWLGQERSRLSGLTDVVKELGISPETWSQWLSQYSSSVSARQNVENAVEQIIQAIQNGNQRLAELLQPLLVARHPSQIYQALMEGLLVFLVCFFVWRKPRKPGVIGGVFLTLYAIMRIIGEQFRMPDAHIGFQIFGLTRGQILSLVQLAASAFFLWWVARRPVEPISGWSPEAMALKEAEQSSKPKK